LVLKRRNYPYALTDYPFDILVNGRYYLVNYEQKLMIFYVDFLKRLHDGVLL